jgi:hypothetical protein
MVFVIDSTKFIYKLSKTKIEIIEMNYTNQEMFDNPLKVNDDGVEIKIKLYKFYYFPQYAYFKSETTNDIANLIMIPYEILKYIFLAPQIWTINGLQYLYFSPYFIYYYGYNILNRINNWLIPI